MYSECDLTEYKSVEESHTSAMDVFDRFDVSAQWRESFELQCVLMKRRIASIH